MTERRKKTSQLQIHLKSIKSPSKEKSMVREIQNEILIWYDAYGAGT